MLMLLTSQKIFWSGTLSSLFEGNEEADGSRYGKEGRKYHVVGDLELHLLARELQLLGK